MNLTIEQSELEKLIDAGMEVKFVGPWKMGEGDKIRCQVKIYTQDGKEIEFKSSGKRCVARITGIEP